jgi:hypothetical protein
VRRVPGFRGALGEELGGEALALAEALDLDGGGVDGVLEGRDLGRQVLDGGTRGRGRREAPAVDEGEDDFGDGSETGHEAGEDENVDEHVFGHAGRGGGRGSGGNIRFGGAVGVGMGDRTGGRGSGRLAWRAA